MNDVKMYELVYYTVLEYAYYDVRARMYVMSSSFIKRALIYLSCTDLQ